MIHIYKDHKFKMCINHMKKKNISTHCTTYDEKEYFIYIFFKNAYISHYFNVYLSYKAWYGI
ncbi:hypothetical protein PFUGPA_05611 [Plasmodium falciparum Palo Alto/Uganda]|uniref:Uncharacterized protein n=1 Tax=Plasmodium falciparum (isolate Palo Alto / Uganda) TaxID=57270 RepID=W4IRB6_PLAFP|nr:hypothetical protein PFUGPA_05611 [Plasmodium falciparum Palo Alto/Uganda]